MQKERFENIAKSIVENSTSVEDITIDEFVTNGFKHVYLVVKFNGGAISVRNVNGNSLLVNLEELVRLLKGGYYKEVETYKSLKEKAEVKLWNYLNCLA